MTKYNCMAGTINQGPPEGYEERRQALMIKQKEQIMTNTPEALKLLKERRSELSEERSSLNHRVQVCQNRLDLEREKVRGSECNLATYKKQYSELNAKVMALTDEILLLERT